MARYSIAAQELAGLPLPPLGHSHDDDANGGSSGPGRPELLPSLSVVLVDRSYDAITPLLQHDHLLDAMLCALPRREPVSPQPGHVCWRYEPS
jgi:hypothetical protein